MTSGGTPTVSKEVTAPPTMLPRRPKSKENLSISQDSDVKQLGSNDYKPHYVFTSKVQTECSENRNGELGNGDEESDHPRQLEGDCVLHCVETTRVYEGDTLMSETTNYFTSVCPDSVNEDKDSGASVRIIEHTIRGGEEPSGRPKMEDAYSDIGAFPSEYTNPVETPGIGSDDYDDYYVNYDDY